MKKTTEERLSATRAAIIRWERRLRRAGNALKKYRAKEARLIRKQGQEVRAASAPAKLPGRKPSRKIVLD